MCVAGSTFRRFWPSWFPQQLKSKSPCVSTHRTHWRIERSVRASTWREYPSPRTKVGRESRSGTRTVAELLNTRCPLTPVITARRRCSIVSAAFVLKSSARMERERLSVIRGHVAPSAQVRGTHSPVPSRWGLALEGARVCSPAALCLDGQRLARAVVVEARCQRSRLFEPVVPPLQAPFPS